MIIFKSLEINFFLIIKAVVYILNCLNSLRKKKLIKKVGKLHDKIINEYRVLYYNSYFKLGTNFKTCVKLGYIFN